MSSQGIQLTLFWRILIYRLKMNGVWVNQDKLHCLSVYLKRDVSPYLSRHNYHQPVKPITTANLWLKSYVFILAAPGLRHVGSSSPTREGTWAPCIGRQSFSHWTTREISHWFCFLKTYSQIGFFVSLTRLSENKVAVFSEFLRMCLAYGDSVLNDW